jgi:hypothetical protein
MVLMAAAVLGLENRYPHRLLLRQEPLKVGERAPCFEAVALQGERVSVPKGPVVLIFFNTSCPSCAESAGGGRSLPSAWQR